MSKKERGKWTCRGGGGFGRHSKTTVKNGAACPNCGRPPTEGPAVSTGYDAEAAYTPDDEADAPPPEVTAAYSVVVPPLGREPLEEGEGGVPGAAIIEEEDVRPQEEVPVVSRPTPPELVFPPVWRCTGGTEDPHGPVLVQKAGREACRICSRVLPDKAATEVTAPYSVVLPPSDEGSSQDSVEHNTEDLVGAADVPPHEIVPEEEADADDGVVPVVDVPPDAAPEAPAADLPVVAELVPPPVAEPPSPAPSAPATPATVEPLPRVIVDPVLRAESFARAANLAAQRALEHADTAHQAANDAEAHARTAGSSAMRAGNRAAAAEKAVTMCEEFFAASGGMAKNTHADAERAEQLQKLAHASAEAANTLAQQASVSASKAEEASEAAQETAKALERRKWTAWAWPVAFVLGCITVFTLSLSLIPSKSDVKVAVQEELGSRGAPPRLPEVPSEPAPAQAPVAQAIAPKVQEQEPPLVPVLVPPQATVVPQPQAVASVPPPAPSAPSAPAPVASAPAVVLAQPAPAPVPPRVQQSTPAPQAAVRPAPAVVANQAPVPAQQPANECEACVNKMRAPPFKFAERDARAGCAFLCGGR